MIHVLNLLLLGLIAFVLVVLGWWLLIATEGAYLGRRVVIWLYDLYAFRYDDVKRYNATYEHALVAQPIMEKIAPQRSPLVLDVATGTGRVPIALLKHRQFQGRVVAVDLSRLMLRNAARKLRGQQGHVSLLWCPAERLPFADNCFDVVTSLEALEFMASPQAVLKEMLRVLRPGGLLLISNRINIRVMPGKIWTREQLGEILVEYGVRDADVEAWQVDYDRVWAIKGGESEPVGSRPVGEFLRCPCCPSSLMVRQENRWVCEICQGAARIGRDGVIEMFPLQSKC